MRIPHPFRKKPVSVPWTPSLSPHLPTPVLIDGRRHIDGVTYVLPKDLPEETRLDFQHHLLQSVLKGNFAAPVDLKTLSRLLDVATGTGRWAHEMARACPHAEVIGFDLEAAEKASLLPSNYHFVQGNIFAGLPFPDACFDFVHQRFLVLALPAKQWPFVVGELYRVTRPGGYIELLEGGGTFLNRGAATQQLQQWWKTASHVNGIDVEMMEYLPHLLKHVGCQQIQQKTYRVPVGKWGGRVGEMLKQDIVASLPAIKAFICLHAHVSADAFEKVVQILPDEWEQCQTIRESGKQEMNTSKNVTAYLLSMQMFVQYVNQR